MSKTIDYFFSTISPFAYLGHRELMAIAARTGATVNFRPFSIGGVWEKSGSVPLAQRSATRQRYRFIELQRIAWQRDRPFNLKPKHFPTNPERADLCCAALVLAGRDVSGFAHDVGEAVWARDLDIADEAVLAELLAANGHDGAAVLAASKGPEATQLRSDNTQAANEADAVGAPAYVYKGEVFWGQDRLEMLEAMIASGRAAFTVPQ